MDSSSQQPPPSGRSPPQRRELQGPRPAPLKVRKDSHKIKKLPLAPQLQSAPPVQVRQPVIIYTVSPKVIHANPSEFMSVVQRLTGAPSTSSASSSCLLPPPPPPAFPFAPYVQSQEVALSPAAQLAAIERATLSTARGDIAPRSGEESTLLDQLGFGAGTRRQLPSPSILSPVPTSLPAISPNFFSPLGYPGSGINFFNELSPAFLGQHRGVMEHTNFFGSASTINTATVSSNFLATPSVPSPGVSYWDLFNQYQNL